MKHTKWVVRLFSSSLSLLLMLGLLIGPGGSALAAPLFQAEEATPQNVELGQFVFRELQIGDSVQFRVDLPASTTYLVTTDNEEEALAFDLVVTDPNGEEVFNGIFETTELPLEPGPHIFTFLAVDSAYLSFVVLGELGAMTPDADQPGVLRPGSIYSESDVSEARYAVLSVPETDYPKQVLLFIEPGVDDGFFLSAEGGEAGAQTISTEDATSLALWTHGGDYRITVEPVERRSRYTLIVFLSGPPPALNLGETVDGVIAAGSSQTAYQLAFDEDVSDLRFSVTSDAGDLTLALVDRWEDGSFFESSTGAVSSLSLESVPAGVYYLFIESAAAAAEENPFTLTATGSAGPPLPNLESGVAVTGTFGEGDASAEYRFEVTQPGTLVSVALQSESEEVNYDISAGMQPGQEIWRSYKLGAADNLEFIAPFAGQYYIAVVSNGNSGPYTVTASSSGPAAEVKVNDVTWGTVDGSATDVHLLPIAETGQLLSVILVGAAEANMGLGLAAYDATGKQAAYSYDPGLNSSAIVSKRIDTPGIYEISVSSLADDGGHYFLVTRLEDAVAALGSQWAGAATASSQLSDTEGSAQQASGLPDTKVAGDAATAWSPAQAEAGVVTLELTYDHAVTPAAVNIYENFNPGAVSAVEAFDPSTESWVVLWQGQDTTTEEPGVFSPEFTPPAFRTSTVRLSLDTDSVAGFNQIDAVELMGRP